MKKLILFIFLLIISRQEVLAVNQFKSLKPIKTRTVKQAATGAARLRKMTTEQVELRKEKISQIKDERKQKIAEHINDRLAHINTRVTTTLSKVLTRLTAILDKLADKTDVTTAREVISVAQAAVEAQAGKSYLIEFTDESGLRVGASAAKETLKADLKIVRELVREARSVVKNSLVAAKATSQ